MLLIIILIPFEIVLVKLPSIQYEIVLFTYFSIYNC